MTLCKWQGGTCDRETSDPSGLCTLHRPKKARPDLEDYILKVREWDETGRTNKALLAEILQLQAALGIKG